jgi:hypothetical protein
VAAALQVLGHAQVVQDAVADVAATDEGRLGHIHQEVEGELQAVGDGLAQQLGVAVQEGEGPVAAEVVPGAGGALVHEHDDAEQQRRERIRRCCPPCKCVLHRC